MKLDGIMEKLAGLTEQLEAEFPEIRAILVEARTNPDVTEAAVLTKFVEFVYAKPEVAKQVANLFESSFALQTSVVEPPASIVVPPASGFGLPRLDPSYEAYLGERLQFDGDIPELRFGPVPKSATPAVPVLTDALDPVAVGWMLEQASSEVARELEQIEMTRITEVHALLGDTPESAALALSDSGLMQKMERDTLPDPAGYVRGQVPALRVVEVPSGWGLSALVPAQRQQLAWRTLSTTQGRLTMVKAIRDLVANGLQSDGYSINVLDGPAKHVPIDQVRAYAEWSVDVSGPNATQASFAFADTAWRVLLRKLEEACPTCAAFDLEVFAINAVDVRRFGFAARLLDPSCS